MRFPIRSAAALVALAAFPAGAARAAAASDPVPAEEASGAAPATTSAAPSEAEPEVSFFETTTVTATGSERSVFQVATPVTVLGAEEIARLAPESPADLLREQPGVDVNGVGPNQARPVIRGQRGLRVLFLEDGLRLNNARRQTDFGEITGLVDLDAVASVEVVRGPASVLYGSDAIGGVLNLVTAPPRLDGGRRFAGSAEARWGEAGDGTRFAGQAAGTAGRWDWQLGASAREAGDYEAPSGRFGAIALADETPVLDSGVDDDTVWGSAGLAANDRHAVRLRFNRYRAGESGFGLVDPLLVGGAETFRIRILYPFQEFDRVALTWSAGALDGALADALDLKAYWQSNERRLVNDIDIDIGPLFPGAPHSSVAADTDNFTDLDTVGLRLEAFAAAGDDHLLTWGAEGYRDDSRNTDFSKTVTTLRFPFPPFEIVRTASDAVANAPNAENESWGVFVQDEWTASERLRLTGGLRWQTVATRAEPTPGWQTAGLDFDDDALVGSLTGTFQLTPELNLLASYGTAFRAPNIVERLFNGPVPEGGGYQLLNPALGSESSENVDLGIKYRRANAFLELVAFRTELEDGIVQYFLSPAEIAALPPAIRAEIAATRSVFVVQQRNAEQLRTEGVELALGYRAESGLTLGANYTYLDSERLDSENPPTGDTYRDKVVAWVRWEPERRPYWIEYRVRANGSTPVNLEPNEPAPPVGTELPSFEVHTVAGGARFERGRLAHELRLAVENLTDELYAEFSNATFFRPEPGRSVQASYRVRF
jgi:outer membrane receptor protein involved in Fe transport